ncbi:MAG: mechanosensitive ion channel family protein [Acidobacteria bacterium]|nr:mechanosensitive ion channel family protein [Acidobacteriota bacterium]
MGLILPYAAVEWTRIGAAALTIVLAFLLAWVIGRLLGATEKRLHSRGDGQVELDPGARTRLRLVRRLVFAAVIAGGVFLALLQFDSFDRLAAAAITSGAVITAILGFAGRDSLANAAAGVAIAVAQPVRVGDYVELDEVSGVIEDLTLMYTWLRTSDDGRTIVPNQVLMTQAIGNDSIGRPLVAPDASVWIEPGADETLALERLGALPAVRSGLVARAVPEGIQLRLTGEPVTPEERGDAEARLRVEALRTLRESGIRLAGSH